MRIVSYLRTSENNTSNFVDNISNSNCEVFCSLMLSLFGVIFVIYLMFCAEVLFKIRGRYSSRWARILQRWLLPRLLWYFVACFGVNIFKVLTGALNVFLWCWFMIPANLFTIMSYKITKTTKHPKMGLCPIWNYPRNEWEKKEMS